MGDIIVHNGNTEQLKIKRDLTLRKAWEKNPERFVNGVPRTKEIPNSVWINRPEGGQNEIES